MADVSPEGTHGCGCLGLAERPEGPQEADRGKLSDRLPSLRWLEAGCSI